MNLARAKRRWRAWDRYEARVIKLCKEHNTCPPGAASASFESANWRRTGVARRYSFKRGDWYR